MNQADNVSLSFRSYLVSHNSPFVQLEEDFAVLMDWKHILFLTATKEIRMIVRVIRPLQTGPKNKIPLQSYHNSRDNVHSEY